MKNHWLNKREEKELTENLSVCINKGDYNVPSGNVEDIIISDTFPSGDEYSLQLGCCSDFPCSYAIQHVQYEKLSMWSWSGQQITYQANHVPIIAGSMTGSINVDGWRVQTFTVDVDGNFKFSSNIKETAANLDLFTGEFVIK